MTSKIVEPRLARPAPLPAAGLVTAPLIWLCGWVIVRVGGSGPSIGWDVAHTLWIVGFALFGAAAYALFRSMADTAVTEPGSDLQLRQLAARHGLHVAGARPNLLAYTKQLWAYRHFITEYANAKVVAAFSTARLGQLWQILTPLANAGVYFLIFGVVLNTRHQVDNFIAYLCTGLFVFTFTSAVVQQGTSSIVANLGLIRALHFPRAVLPIAVMLTQFQNLVASIIVLVGIVLVFGEPITLEWFLLIPTLLLQSVFNAGLALAMARLGAKFTDLSLGLCSSASAATSSFGAGNRSTAVDETVAPEGERRPSARPARPAGAGRSPPQSFGSHVI